MRPFAEQVANMNEDLIYSGSVLRVDYRLARADFTDMSKRPWKLIGPDKVRSFARLDSILAAVRKELGR